MKDNEDPNKLFEILKTVEVRFNTPSHKIKEEDRMSVALSRAPREYQDDLTTERQAKGAAVNAEDLEETINQH